MGLSYKDVAEILKIIDASQCEEVVLELEGLRLVVRRSNSGGVVPANSVRATAGTIAQTSATPALGSARPSPSPNATGAAHPALAQAEGKIEVRAPMVGTFYRRPSPQEAPFVEPGQRVKAGDPLCLVEVMKLFTTLSAPADGTIAAIAVEDGAAIEFDQLLFLLAPA